MQRKDAALAMFLGASMLAPASSLTSHAQDATPTTEYTCESVANAHGAGTPGALMGDMAGMAMGTPTAGVDQMAMELDQAYIDMMIPHHESIIAMAQAGLPRLTDARLQAIAGAIIEAQGPEIAELQEYREAFYGDPDPMPMDAGMMAAMEALMPGMSGTTEEMAFQMDAEAQAAAICAADDADLAFIDLTISHHQMAIEASEIALKRAVHPEALAFAQRVIADQQREIEAVAAIRAEIAGEATPVMDHGGSHASDAVQSTKTSSTSAAASAIFALTADQIAQIERGDGAGFALPAERNGVPGPRHVLELAAELGLSSHQEAAIQAIHDGMQSAALPAGQRYLEAEAALEADLRAGRLPIDALAQQVLEVSRLQGELATVHLRAHVQTADVLTPEQVATYVVLRDAR